MTFHIPNPETGRVDLVCVFEKKNENIGSGVPGNTSLQPCVHLSLEQDSSGHTFHRGREWPPILKNKQGVLQGLERENCPKGAF